MDNKIEESYRTLISTAVDFVFSLNEFGYIQEINENGASALGYNIDEMLDKHFVDFVDKSKRTETSSAFQKMLKNKTATHFEIVFFHKLHKPITYEFMTTPLLDNNTITGIIGVGRDISVKRKNKEIIKELNIKLDKANRLVSLERDRAKKQITVLEELNMLKSEFISNVSHELRTPLASIVGFAETLSLDDDLSQETIKEFSNIIFAEGKRLARFIEDILDFSKLEDSKNFNKEKSDLIELLNEVISDITPIIEEKKINLITEIPEAEISIFADKEKLSKAFLTIIENAIHYIESKGQITIFVQDFLKEVEVFVSDTGVGIPEKELKLFFDKFHSTGSGVIKSPITGAALSLAKQIIEFHEGILQVKSIVGEGTTMIVHLPKIIN
ncbi:MAG: histidine kinase dimerization/phospho-acceptor domain-containing protein [Bacteroidota bacterium]